MLLLMLYMYFPMNMSVKDAIIAIKDVLKTSIWFNRKKWEAIVVTSAINFWKEFKPVMKSA